MEVIAVNTRPSLFPEKISKHILFRWLYRLLVLASAVWIVLTGHEVEGAVLYALFMSAVLVLSSRVTDTTLPFLLLTVFITKCYNSYDTFIGYLWLAVPVLAALVFHFVYYQRRPKIGPGFWGIAAVSLALTLGGIGSISASDYFTPMTLYYTFGLGLGMLVAYLLIEPCLGRIETMRMLRYLYFMGLFAAFCVFRFYAEEWDTFRETHQNLSFQSSNNLATFLMIALPIPFYYARKNPLHFLTVPVLFAAIFFCNSRGGLLMGTLELILLFLAFSLYNPDHLFHRITCIVLLFVSVYLLWHYLPEICEMYRFEFDADTFANYTFVEKWQYLYRNIVNDGEARAGMIPRAIEAWKKNPLFGAGIGDHSNADLYNPKKGFFNCYHMWVPQIIGSMGTLGIAAYLFQFVGRILLVVKNRNYANVTLALCYLGLWLMSQVNPGEFCPLPYGFLGVFVFLLIEKNALPNKPKASHKKGGCIKASR